MMTPTPIASAPPASSPAPLATTEGLAPLPPDGDAWGLPRRIAFRFAFVYLFLYFFPSHVDYLPGMDLLSQGHEKLWQRLVPWVGKHVLSLEKDITVFTNGSGDTTFNYVQVLCYAVLATVGALVWSVLDRRRGEYTKAFEVLRVFSRYALAAALISYGLSKVFKTQFPFPGPDRLLSSYGESSPMGLLWTFMGYSRSYNVFTGAAEVLGGLLLLFRRTTLLGALVAIGVMANVVMLNFSYDIPVKLYSSHLLLTAVFLVLPDARRLANLLVLNRPTEPVVLRTPLRAPWMEWAGRGAKALLIGWLLFTMTKSRWERVQQYGDDAPRSPFFGVFEVEEFSRNGETLPPLLTDETRWRGMTVEHFDLLTLRRMNGKLDRFRLEVDPEKQTFALTRGGPDKPRHVLTYSWPDPEHLVLEGPFGEDRLRLRLKKVDASKFLLVNRGFHWINEYPLNR